MILKLSNIVSPVSAAIFSGLITWFITVSINQDQTKIRYIDYDIQKTTVFQDEQNSLKDKLKVIINSDTKNSVKEISKITLTLYNLSDKDFDKLKLYIDFIPKKPSNKTLKLIFHEVDGQYQDNTKILTWKTSESNPNKKVTYEISKINRSDWREVEATDQSKSSRVFSYGVQPVFKSTYTIAGDKLSEIDIKPRIEELGVRGRILDFENILKYKAFQEKKWINWIWLEMPIFFLYLVIAALLLSYILIGYLVYRLFAWIEFLQEQKTIRRTSEKILEPNCLNQLYQISDPLVLSKELVGINRAVRNQKNDDKFQKILFDKLSQPNAVDEFRKLDEQKIANMLSSIEQEISKRKQSFLRFITGG
jgi:hypothetical protein